MLIESLIKRPTAPVNIGGRDYFFRPLDGNPTSPHVCDVEDMSHAARLLEITEGYRAAEMPKPLTRAPSPPQVPEKTAGTGSVPPIEALSQEQSDRVSALRASNVADLRSVVPSITDLAVLRELLNQERGAPQSRATVVALVEARIATLSAA